MKRIIVSLILCIAAGVLFGCSDQSAAPPAAANDSETVANTSADTNEDNSVANATAANTDGESEIIEPETAAEDVLEIREKMFIAQCNDIFLNAEDYLDKTIKVEGMYQEYTDPLSGETYHFVNRNGPGCCGDDGVVGFEIFYDGEAPQINDWIEAIGKIEIIKEGDYEYLILRLSKLTVLDERGAEYVIN